MEDAIGIEASTSSDDLAREKIFNDCVHDTVKLPPAALAVMDTPQFQRLRRLKQLGTVHLVYPSATHNRFQHSLGVAHIAASFAEWLRKDNELDDKDVLCVMLAGLCHDLGHGPMSHMWETFVHMANENRRINSNSYDLMDFSGDAEAKCKGFRHEDMSISMFDALLEENKVDLKAIADLDDRDIIFIKEMIAGPLENSSNDGWTLKGRGPEKAFLYDIVANKTNGIDVDKLDYFQRDCHFLNLQQTCKHDRYIAFTKVVSVHEKGCTVKRISIRDKERPMLEEVFHTRKRLHQTAYQHRVVKITERMMLDAWLLADPYLKLPGSDGKHYTLSTAHLNVALYTSMTDEYVDVLIRNSSDVHLRPAAALLKRIECRDLYKCLITIDLIEQKFQSVCDRSTFDIEHDIILSTKKLGVADIAVIRRKIVKGCKLRNTLFHDKCENLVVTNNNDYDENEDDVIIHDLLLCVKSRENVAPATEAFNSWVRKFD